MGVKAAEVTTRSCEEWRKGVETFSGKTIQQVLCFLHVIALNKPPDLNFYPN